MATTTEFSQPEPIGEAETHHIEKTIPYSALNRSEEEKGHRDDILGKPLLHVTEGPENPDLIRHTDHEGKGLTSKEYLEEHITELTMNQVFSRMAHNIDRLFEQQTMLNGEQVEPLNTTDTIICTIPKGANYTYAQMQEKSANVNQCPRIDIPARRTDGDKLADDVTVGEFNPEQVKGKTAILIDGVLDSGLTVLRVAEALFAADAERVIIVVAINKVKTSNKHFNKYVEIVGISMEDEWMGGCGEDIRDDILRDSPAVYILKTQLAH